MSSGWYHLALGNASSDSSLKKSCCKITLILINKRASKLFRLKMLYTFVRSQGICVANHAADLPCFLKISSMCLPIFIRFQSWFSSVMLLSAAKVWNKSQYISTLLSKCFLITNLFFHYSTDTVNRLHPHPSHDTKQGLPSDFAMYDLHGSLLLLQPEPVDHDR